MKKSRFTEEQILFALKQGDSGQPVADVCRRMGISEATYYNWKKRYGNLGLLEVRELRQLRDENAWLKRLVADLTLDRHMLQEVIKERSSHAQTPGHRTMDTGLLSAERTPRLRVELSAQRHVVLPLLARNSSVLQQRIRELATARPRFTNAQVRRRWPSRGSVSSGPAPKSTCAAAPGAKSSRTVAAGGRLRTSAATIRCTKE